MKRKCAREGCGKSFLPTRPKQMYCSSQCRTYAFRDRNKKNEKLASKIKYKKPPLSAYDSKKGTVIFDEAGKWAEPKKEKTMPAGLSKAQQLRWMRENKSKK
jgi:hypothetical protein